MIDVRDHHHHLLGLKGGVRLEGVDQGVVKDFDLPQRARARHKAQGPVLCAEDEGRVVPPQHGLLELS